MFIRWKGDGSRLVELVRLHEVMKNEDGTTKKDPITGYPVLGEEIKDTREVKTFGTSVLLGPGYNELSADEWKIAWQHLQLEMKAGLLKVVKLPASGKGESKQAQSITDLSVEDALKLIEGAGKTGEGKDVPIGDRGVRDTLYRWMVADGRDSVQNAIMDRLRKLRILVGTDKPLEKDLAYQRARLSFEGGAFDPEADTEGLPEE